MACPACGERAGVATSAAQHESGLRTRLLFWTISWHLSCRRTAGGPTRGEEGADTAIMRRGEVHACASSSGANGASNTLRGEVG